MKNIWFYIRLAVVIGVIIFLYAFAMQKNNARKISKIHIEMNDETMPFITQNVVNNLLIENLKSGLNTPKENINLLSCENLLNKNPMIKKSQVYVSIDGVLQAKIEQRKPIARFVQGYQSYYIDEEGKRMPLSDNFAARVPLVSGYMAEKHKDSTLLLFKSIKEDIFLEKNIVGIYIDNSGEIFLKNREDTFEIAFGKPVEIDKKLQNYKAFYQFTYQNNLLKNYKKITLAYTKQVIGIK